jgi:Mrp family chromosome partitioning ATPase
MGRVLDTLKQNTPRRNAVATTVAKPITLEEEESAPFIEVGGKQQPIEGSPDVMAVCAPSRPIVAEVAPRLTPVPADEPESAGLTVFFRPITAEPGPARSRFAPELVSFHKPEHVLAKQYQALAGNLTQQLPATRSRVLLFTAVHPASGTTTVLLNLAIAVARQGKQRVVAVDANLHQPAIAERLGLPEAPGLAEVLSGAAPLQEVLRESGQPNLLALTAGQTDCVGSGRLSSEAMRAVLRQLRARFDLVVVDAPCWSSRGVLLPLALLCEAVYLVSPEGEAQDAETAVLLRTLTEQGVPVRGHLITVL